MDRNERMEINKDMLQTPDIIGPRQVQYDIKRMVDISHELIYVVFSKESPVLLGCKLRYANRGFGRRGFWYFLINRPDKPSVGRRSWGLEFGQVNLYELRRMVANEMLNYMQRGSE